MLAENFAHIMETFLGDLAHVTGAFLIWVIKGFKTNFKNELSDRHIIRNVSIGAVLFIIVFGLLVYLALLSSFG